MQAEIELSPEAQTAFNLIENTRSNVFLTGRAGTGKSTFLRYLRQHTRRNTVICAPTGIAALNVGAQTIHSLFCLPAKFIDIQEMTLENIKIRRVLRNVSRVIIDEVSMVRADLLDAVDRHLRLTTGREELPFGGVQVLLIGDPYQLPPVVTNHGSEHFHQYYQSPHFFRSPTYLNAGFKTIELTKVYRQTDQEFVDILNAVRAGEVSDAQWKQLNTQVVDQAKYIPGQLVLTGTNALADRINNLKMSELRGVSKVFNGWSEGTVNFASRVPAPRKLELKIGAQVMILQNDRGGQRYANGSVGIVTDFPAEGGVTVQLPGGDTVMLSRTEWETFGYEYCGERKKIIENVVGKYAQVPVVPAWASTVHKSQGKTLDNLFLNLGKQAFAAGQTYVALSRCRSLAGISLRRPLTQDDLICDKEVISFMNNIRKEKLDV